MKNKFHDLEAAEGLNLCGRSEFTATPGETVFCGKRDTRLQEGKMSVFDEFRKSKDYLICIDSDGCAMDTMDIKHFESFGPCMVREWHLEEWQDAILTRWNEINLYTMTRGINRFKGLVTALKEIDGTYRKIEDLDSLINWVDTTKELSNAAIERAIAEKDSLILKKALAWSVAVNETTKKIPEEKLLPFDGVKEAIAFAHEKADIAIVSSANPEAVYDEWERHGLMEHVDIVLAQNAGTKAFCIGELLKKGYDAHHVLMVGDAPGDRDAADKNGVLYYPILVKREVESWKRFKDEAVEKLLAESFEGEYQEELKKEFVENLS